MADQWWNNDPPEAAEFVAGIDSPFGFDQLLMEGLQEESQQTLHCAFKRWKNALGP